MKCWQSNTFSFIPKMDIMNKWSEVTKNDYLNRHTKKMNCEK